jgi:hypothetical protein
MTPNVPLRASVTAGSRRHASGMAAGLGEWQRFAGPRFRAFHAVGFSQGAVGALAGGAVTTPLMLALGAPAAMVLVVAILPGIGSLTQLLMPAVLRRTDGNLRGVTLAISLVGDTRGFWFAAIVALAATGVLTQGAALAAIVVASVIAALIGGLSGSNVLAWYHAVLPESERRFVSPRTGAVGAIAGAALLTPTAFILHDADAGVAPFILPFLVAGLASIVGLVGLYRLPHPGRVTVPDAGRVRAERPAGLDRFVRISTVGALGFGIGPPLSIYAIVVLGLSPGFTVALSALGTLASLIASTVVSSTLERQSAAHVLRGAHAIRAVAMTCGLLAFPGNPLAALLLIAAAVLGASGDAAAGLASSERIFRLAAGPAAIAHQARYVAATSTASAGAQLTASGILAFGSGIGYPVYAILFVSSAAVRTVTAIRFGAPVRDHPAPSRIPVASPALGG